MGKNVKIELDMKKIADMAVQGYVDEHAHECAICHKPVTLDGPLPSGSLPVCQSCEKKMTT